MLIASTACYFNAHSSAVGAFPLTFVTRIVQEVQVGLQLLFSEQRQRAVSDLMAAVRASTQAARKLADTASEFSTELRTRLVADAAAAIVVAAGNSLSEMTAELERHQAWAQERLLPSFCTVSDYRFNTC